LGTVIIDAGLHIIEAIISTIKAHQAEKTIGTMGKDWNSIKYEHDGQPIVIYGPRSLECFGILP
jgi:hypothetical protein